jgi:hypothetical protein
METFYEAVVLVSMQRSDHVTVLYVGGRYIVSIRYTSTCCQEHRVQTYHFKTSLILHGVMKVQSSSQIASRMSNCTGIGLMTSISPDL